MAQKSWKLIVYETDDSTPDFSITDDYLVEPLKIGGQRVYPLDCRAEALSWEAEVGDFSEFLTGNMTDGSYHMQLVGRLVEAQIDSGSGFVTRWTGRIQGMRESEGPGKWSLRFTEDNRRGDIWIYETTSTAVLFALAGGYQAQNLTAWYNRTAYGTPQFACTTSSVSGDYVRLQITTPITVNDDVLQALHADLEAGGGSTFDTQCFVGGFSRDIIIFAATAVGVGADPSDTLDAIDTTIAYVWVLWPDASPTDPQPSPPDGFSDFEFQPASLPVNESFPYHVGGNFAGGNDIIQEIKDRYDDHGVRYDSTAFSTYNATTNPLGLLAHPDIPDAWAVYTERQELHTWAADIYAGLGLLPVINADGEISPRFLPLPDPVGLPAVVDDDLGEPAVFDHVGEEIVTVVTGTVRNILYQSATDGDGLYPNMAVKDVPIATDGAFTYDHTNASVIRATYNIDIPLLIGEFGPNGPLSEAAVFCRARADDIFDRWAYGPIWVDVYGLEALASLDGGGWAMFTLSNFPSHIAGSRTATPFTAQVMERRFDPEGPHLRLLMGGLNDQPYAS